MRSFVRPFVLIQLCAAGLLVGYLLSPAVREACAGVAAWSERGGIVLAGLIAAAAGGVFPEIAKRLTIPGHRWTRPVLADAAFATAFFFVLGIVVHLLYAAQGLIFGDDGRFTTSVKKMLVDQFFYVLIFGNPFGLAMFALWKARFHPVRWWRAFASPGFVERYLTLLLPTWAFWVPMNLITYTLPVPLQFAMFALALAAWGLIVACVATPAGDPRPT